MSTGQSFACSILFIDDDLSLLNLYQKILKGEGHEVATVSTREAALDWLKTHPAPDIVFLDGRMGGPSNDEFRRKIDTHFAGRPSPRLVGFSSFSKKSPFAEEMRALFGEFIEKPSDLKEFIDVVKEICRQVKCPS